MTAKRISVADIPPTLTPATPARLVHLHYQRTPGIVDGSASWDVIPALVIRAFPGCGQPGQPTPTHTYVNVVPFGDGPNNCPIVGAGEPLFSLYLFDPLDGAVPAGLSARSDGQLAGRIAWCEWMPYQATKHQAQRAAGGEAGSTA